jgi:catechol 2,3-dioxygenase-like lactoylglutathione lyase family enzyme
MTGHTRRRFLKESASALALAAVPLPAPVEERPLVTSIDGPLVSTRDLARQRTLFEGVFGLLPVAEQRLTAAEVEALWGVKGRAARSVLLETKGTAIGVRLVAFEPPSEIAIREGAAGIDSDALKVIDFVVTDFEAGVAALEKQGFKLSAPPAKYEVPKDGRFTEGHAEGPEGVKCALLKIHDASLDRFVRVQDRLFSEVLGVSAPVSDPAPIASFYEALGLRQVYRYEIENESFQHLLGAGRKTKVVGINYGHSEKAVVIGIVHYGLPAGSFRSLRDRSVLPHRGTVALRLTVRSVEAAAEACRAKGGEILAPPAAVELAPQGKVRSLTVRAPHGVVHHFLERA